ncbi:MAG: thiamine-phosphate kinase [Verrucomicrobiota bacterium]|nr:thiamine-phosphate kinase [Limisphaera sp.]MDW8381424.1 thiamine-phosphate kinase [Verrucomicrobiota bacterium]
MDEFTLIRQWTRDLPTRPEVLVPAGDDCAVLRVHGADHDWLFKTDAVVEGVHFTPEAAPERIGHKALARCLSDLAAMGGLPLAAVITIGLPQVDEAARVQKIYAGITELARRYQMAIVGGETTRSPGGLFLSVAVWGWVERGRAILRSGARPGDAIFVTGELGGSAAGKHLDFEPRIREARWLMQHFDIHAMIDLSDGLAGDLRHILQASNVGAELLKRAIPVSRAAKQAALRASSAKPPLVAALTDGEDFELLFTVSSRDAVTLLDAWKQAFPDVRLTCIGKILAEPVLTLRDRNGVEPLTLHGFQHFCPSNSSAFPQS